MTDVELLPLPSPQVPFIDCDPSMTDIRRLVRWYEQGATEYARANVSRATARLQAEIEALRAEVVKLRNIRADAVHECALANIRAVELEEALRELVAVFSESGMYDEEVLVKARAALDREEGK